MSTLDATISMLEAMPEDARIKVMEFHPETVHIQKARKPIRPGQSGTEPIRPCRITPADF